MPKKMLSEADFEAAINGLDVGPQTIMIARGVLVEGRPQTEFAEALNISKGAVSQAVARVWEAHKQRLPDGYERVSVVLPRHQAYQVRKWAEEARKGQEEDE